MSSSSWSVSDSLSTDSQCRTTADWHDCKTITGTPCASKFDIVQQCCVTLIWVSWLKSDIIPVLLNEAADVMEGLAESVPANLPKMQAKVLDHFVNHLLRPS